MFYCFTDPFDSHIPLPANLLSASLFRMLPINPRQTFHSLVNQCVIARVSLWSENMVTIEQLQRVAMFYVRFRIDERRKNVVEP